MTERTFNAVDWMVASHQLVPAGLAPLAIAYDANGKPSLPGPKDVRLGHPRHPHHGDGGRSPLGTYDYDAQLQRVKADTADGHVEVRPGWTVCPPRVGRQEIAATIRRGEGWVSRTPPPQVAPRRCPGSVSVEVSLAQVEAARPPPSPPPRTGKYDAWGNYPQRDGSGWCRGSPWYTGHQYDVESGLTYARARYYDSVQRVSCSRDSVEGISVMPRVCTVGPTPTPTRLRYTDPTGHCGIDRYGRFIPVRPSPMRGRHIGPSTGSGSRAKSPATFPLQGGGTRNPDFAVELGAALVDLGRLGEGAAEGRR